MSTASRLILITGASGAIGSALACAYAAPGVELLLQGRSRPALAETARRCENQGAQTRLIYLDLTDASALQSWLDALIQERLPDLVILAAGINIDIGSQGEGEALEKVTQLLTINLQAPLLMANTLASRMKARGSGQLIFISSLAAWHGLPATPSYCASKAGLKAYGEALRSWLSPHGVGVSVVMPGYVESPMATAMPGPKPFQWSSEKAAKAIQRGIERNQARISFPFPLNLGTWCLAVLPAAISQRLVSWFGYGAPHE